MSEAFHTILSIPDDDETRNFLRDLFQKAQIVVEEAGSEAELLRRVETPSDLVILGSRWLDPSASELCRRLRLSPQTRQTAIVCLVETPGSADLSDLADHTVALPVDPPKVIHLLAQSLKPRSQPGFPGSWRRLFDQIGDGIGLLDGSGSILLGNRELWEVLEVPEPATCPVKMEDWAAGWPPAGHSWPVFRAIRLRRTQVQEWNRGDRWFRITIDPLLPEAGAEVGELLLMIADITESRNLRSRIAEAEAARQASEMRISTLERDARMLLKFSESSADPTVSRGADGPLRQRDSSCFCEMVEAYDRLLDLMLDQRHHQVEHQQEISQRLKGMADRLGLHQAGPRDVVEIHGTALRRAAQEQNAGRSRMYFEEGRLLVLELMGHVLSYYRTRTTSVTENADRASAPLHPGDVRKAN